MSVFMIAKFCTNKYTTSILFIIACISLNFSVYAENTEHYYKIDQLNNIFLLKNKNHIKIIKNNNNECLEKKCLIDIFIGNNHITSIDFFSTFSVKNYIENEKIYLILDNGIDRDKYYGFITVIINSKYKNIGCSMEDAYAVNNLAELPQRINFYAKKISMYFWLENVGCITVFSYIQINKNLSE